MTPLERDRELGHKALLRYLKASGFRLLPDAGPSPAAEGETVQRFRHRRKTTVQLCERPKHVYVYTVASTNGEPQKVVTRSPFSIMTHMERLLDDVPPPKGQG